MPSGAEKAAILLLTLPSESAAAVFCRLGEREVRQLTAVMARARTVRREDAAAVHEEAWRRLAAEDEVAVDGAERARRLVSAALSAPAPPAHGPGAAAERLGAMLEAVPPAALGRVLGAEHPQVTALALASLRPGTAAAVLAALPEALQADVVGRIAGLQPVSDEAFAEVAEVLGAEVHGLERGAGSTSFLGAKLVADILSAVDPALETRLLAHLEAAAPEAAGRVRALGSSFEDLARLDDRGMQELLREVPRDVLLLALRTATASMRDRVFANLPGRVAEILREDLGTMPAAHLREIERAQADILAALRRLEGERRMAGPGGEDDVLV